MEPFIDEKVADLQRAMKAARKQLKQLNVRREEEEQKAAELRKKIHNEIETIGLQREDQQFDGRDRLEKLREHYNELRQCAPSKEEKFK
ncbi:MAG: hypothetical protein DRG24_03555 [Epsilonproteobacteria bacterium]|nr:MAG: hypothetical protein DRG24_03555 [Campylobacterota bacterium]